MEDIHGRLFNKDLLLSVIIPVYNVEKYLPKCMESVRNQTYRYMEILLIDDGSTDKCPKICDRYAYLDERVMVIHKHNEGLVRARKTGLDIAKGEYITFVDGDDWIEADMYLNLMREIGVSEADFVDSGYYCDKNGKSYKEKQLKRGMYHLDLANRYRIYQTLFGLDNFLDISPSIWSKVFKADLIKKSYEKVPDSMQYGEDLINLLYCVLNAKKMFRVENVFYHYNYRGDSMSHKKSVSYIRKELDLWKYCGEIVVKNAGFLSQEDMDRSLFQKFCLAFQHLFSNEFDVLQYFRFPYIESLFGKRVAVYGAGKVGRDYITQISKYEKCQIICWADKNYKQLCFPYRDVIGIEELLGKSYDLILIAVEKKEIAMEIRKGLLEKGVSDSKIYWCQPDLPF